MMTRSQRRLFWGLIAALFVISAGVSEWLSPRHKAYVGLEIRQVTGDYKDERGARGALKGTAFQTLIPTLLGVREVLASLMWVQADDYFHRGEYRPIIQMVKQITAIDPHQLDVYATGAWHMAYNFMDKRLIADGVQFLEEGTKNNPAVYDLFFELGYMHYDKTKDYPKAVAAYRQASEKGTTTGKKVPPSYVRHQLAHAMEKMGDVDQAIQQWDRNVEIARNLVSEGERDYSAAGPNLDASRHNRYITARRRNERLAAIAERERNAAEALKNWEANVALAQDWLKESPNHPNVSKDLLTAQNQVERLRAGKLYPLAQTALNVQYTVTRVAPRQILVEGTCNALDLSRMNIVLRDKDYEERSRNFDFKMKNATLEWDNVQIKGGKFRHTFKLDKDPADMERKPEVVYPLGADQYELILTYNPRLQAAFIQDVYGWSGEGLTAPEGKVVIDEQRAGIIHGKKYPLRLIRDSVLITREDILGTGRKVLHVRK